MGKSRARPRRNGLSSSNLLSMKKSSSIMAVAQTDASALKLRPLIGEISIKKLQSETFFSKEDKIGTIKSKNNFESLDLNPGRAHSYNSYNWFANKRNSPIDMRFLLFNVSFNKIIPVFIFQYVLGRKIDSKRIIFYVVFNPSRFRDK